MSAARRVDVTALRGLFVDNKKLSKQLAGLQEGVRSVALQMEAFDIGATEREAVTVKSGSTTLSVASILAWADFLADEGLAGLASDDAATRSELKTALPQLVDALTAMRNGLAKKCPRFCRPPILAGLSDLVAAGKSLRSALG